MIYTEKNLLNIESEEEKIYIINTLLNKERVAKKIETSNGYIGSVEKVNGEFRKTFSERNFEKIK